jgi:transcription elongation GreA/GreB family factor
LELSYLAGAQAQRVADLQQTLHYYQQMEFRKFTAEDSVATTAVVELVSNGRKTLYLIAQFGGGMRLSVGGKTIQVITPLSPVGEELVGRRVGDSVEIDAQGIVRDLEITAIA